MKARFDKRQNKVTVMQLNGKDYIFLCLNGKTVKETPEGQDEPQTFYEYDYTEITAETGAVDLDDVKKNPDQYAAYEPEREKNGTFASPATAFASNVLPVPGGPTRSTPFGILAPT